MDGVRSSGLFPPLAAALTLAWLPMKSLCFVLFLSAITFGCTPKDEIRTYRVPAERPGEARPQTPAMPMMAHTSGGRMIAAMLRGDRQAWYFKVQGPNEQIETVAQNVNAFLKTIRFPDGAKQPSWETPSGWKELPARGMRIATLKIPAGEAELELTVIPLSLRGEWDAMVRDDVNRWRGQVGLLPMKPGGEEGISHSKVDGRDWAVVDLKGQAKAAAKPDTAAAPKSQPPEPKIERVTHQTPDSWKELPPTDMRRVNLAVGEGKEKAEITVFAFSSELPAMADPLQNINRWRRLIGMDPTTQEDLDKALEDVQIDGSQAKYIELLPDGGSTHTIAAMITRGQQVWFFKLHGAQATVNAERETFRKWLASVRFQD